MKKGFTLIEIIISIGLIIIISLSATIVVIDRNNRDFQEVNNVIFQSAKVYLETEVDEKGNTYKEGIFKGGTALVIPLKVLKDEGYLSNDVIKTLDDKSISQNEYILAAVFSDASDYCTDSDRIIQFQSSWDTEFKSNMETTYLCEYSTNFSDEDDMNFQVDLEKIAVSQDFYNNLSSTNKVSFTVENGEYLLYDEDEEALYKYFRGAVKNNYVKFGKDKSGNDLIWRILWFKDINEAQNDGFERMKLVLDDVIPIEIPTEDGSIINIAKGDSLHYLKVDGRSTRCYFLITDSQATLIKNNLTNGAYSYELEGNSKYYYCYNSGAYTNITPIYDLENFEEHYDFTRDSNLFYEMLLTWYNSTDLDESANENYILNEHCYNVTDLAYSLREDYRDLNCFSAGESSIGRTLDRKISLLNQGDIVRAGLYNTDVDIDNDNYLVNENKNHMIYFSSDKRGYSDQWVFIENKIGDNNSGYGYNTTLIDSVTRFNKFTLTVNDTKILENELKDLITESFTFLADNLKPTIIIDLTKAKLEGNGTSGNHYTLVAK